jgi:hypothetical protein
VFSRMLLLPVASMLDDSAGFIPVFFLIHIVFGMNHPFLSSFYKDVRPFALKSVQN